MNLLRSVSSAWKPRGLLLPTNRTGSMENGLFLTTIAWLTKPYRIQVVTRTECEVEINSPALVVIGSSFAGSKVARASLVSLSIITEQSNATVIMATSWL